MRLLICAGGTGGGVNPALAVLQAMHTESSSTAKASLSIHWVGGVGGIEVELLAKAGVPVETISAGQVHGVGLRAVSSMAHLARGYMQSRRILRQFQPDVMLFTGGYIAVPMALAGRRLSKALLPSTRRSIPSLLYVPDIEPGLALKTLAHFADCIAVTAEDSRAFFSRRARVEVTGYPVRQELLRWCSSPDRAAARQALSLSENLPVLLVFGGSKGARTINRALLAALPELLKDMQIVHISGTLDWPEVEAAREALPQRLADAAWVERYHAFAYLHAEMGAALAAADLVVNRAGASSLGEFTALGLPAILVPYPHAWRYQQVNAQYLERHGAARIVQDADLSEQLLPAIRDLISNPRKRENMRQAMISLARLDAAHSISNLLYDLADRSVTAKNSETGDLHRQEGIRK